MKERILDEGEDPSSYKPLMDGPEIIGKPGIVLAKLTLGLSMLGIFLLMKNSQIV